MKKYFTKYLPVEGEIREGELAYDIVNPDYRIPLCTTRFENGVIYDERGFVRLKEHLRPVKLFLCSRDIQVGEEVTCTDSSSVNYGKKAKHFEYGDTTNWAKVIGEISPGATWVTEGMEFDGDELNIIEHIVAERCGNNATNEFYCNYMLPKEWIDDHSDWWTDGTVIPGKTIVKIKGPCGHFH